MSCSEFTMVARITSIALDRQGDQNPHRVSRDMCSYSSRMYPTTAKVNCHARQDIGQHLLNYLVDFRPPPGNLLRRSCIEDGEEDQDASSGYRTVKCGTEDKVVLLLPLPVAPLDPEAEDETHDGPAAVVGAGSGRDVVQPTRKDGNVDLTDPGGLWKYVTLHTPDCDG